MATLFYFDVAWAALQHNDRFNIRPENQEIKAFSSDKTFVAE